MKPVICFFLLGLFTLNSCGQNAKQAKIKFYLNKAFYLPINARSWNEREAILQLQRHYLDSALMLDKNNLEAYDLKVNSFINSKKLDSAIKICNVVLNSWPEKLNWYVVRGKLYQQLKKEELARRDFDVIKTKVTKSVQNFDTLQHINLVAKLNEAIYAQEIGAHDIAYQLLEKARKRFPDDAQLKKVMSALKLNVEMNKNGRSVVKYGTRAPQYP